MSRRGGLPVAAVPAPTGPADLPDVAVLGPVAVRRQGHLLPVRSGKQRLVLATLAAARGRPVPADELVQALWGERPPATAAGTLQTHVSRLRSELADAEGISHGAAGYRLDVTRVAVDAVTFERLAERAGAATADEEVLALADGALTLWRGTPYENVDGAGRLEDDRALLVERRWALVERRLDVRLRAGEHAQLVPELEALAREAPLREEVHGRLVLALYRCGRQADALAACRRLRHTLADQLGVDPSPRLQRLELDVLAQSAALELAAPRSTVVHEPGTSFVGRRTELALVRDLLASGRLVTLVGTGGCGKTRLALETARQAPGAVVVELAPVTAGELVLPAVADALGVARGEPAAMLARVAAALRERNALLVLDNAEHLVEPCGQLVTELLAAGGGCRLLVTSRSPLQLPAERLFLVPPLDVPAPDAELAALPTMASVQLFCDRAAAARTDFRLGAHNAASVVQVCRAVDGLPLAIELAAGALSGLGVEELARRVSGSLAVLAGGGARAPRHRTLRAALSWSYELLPPGEQLLLRRLAVFPGRFDAAAAERVCADAALPERDVLPGLVALTRASLLNVDADGAYQLLQTVRTYTAELPGGDVDLAGVRRRHADYLLAAARDLPRSAAAPGYDAAMRRVDAVADSIGPVLAELEARGAHAQAGELFARIWWWWYARGRLAEGAAWSDRLLSGHRPDRPAVPAAACNGAAFLAYARGEYETAEAWAAQARAAAAGGDDLHEQATAHLVRSLVARYRGQLEVAREQAGRALAVHEQLGDLGGIAHCVADLGDIALRQGDLAGTGEAAEQCLARAAEAFEQSLIAARRIDDRWAIARALLLLGEVAARTGEPARVLELSGEAVALAEELGDRRATAWALRLLGQARADLGDVERGAQDLRRALAVCYEIDDRLGVAQRLESLGALARDVAVFLAALGAADVLRDELATPRSSSEQERVERRLAAARACSGEAGWAVARQRGRQDDLVTVLHRVLDAPVGAGADDVG